MAMQPQQAWKILIDSIEPLTAIGTPLDEAVGCYLAEDLHADRDEPPTDRSAMDGYAVRSAEIASPPVALRIEGEVPAGAAPGVRLTPGGCIRVFTGSVVPEEADAVVRVEDCAEDDTGISVKASVHPGENIRYRGEVWAASSKLLSRGTCLTPMRLAICASIGRLHLPVIRKPRIALLVTGNELRPLGAPVAPHQIRDANGPAIGAVLTQAGFGRIRPRQVRDQPEQIRGELCEALEHHDVVLLSGGVSVGRHDLVPGAVRACGGDIRYHGLAMKPGKPQLYARFPGNRHVFGLPGNPLSALTGLTEFVLPALRLLGGCPADRCRWRFLLPLVETCSNPRNRIAFTLVRLLNTESGLSLKPVSSHGSADMKAAAVADGVAALPPGRKHIPRGTAVEFTAWRPLW
ncbi:MAG: molybdopterin molybdotransferase MoeA [Kiritimatiellaeota bacterium]|nr:molybdopterin molybdotransferase MoeA [Kiritimatiellota bacterium]